MTPSSSRSRRRGPSTAIRRPSFTEFPRIFPTTPLGKPGDPRKPTIEVSSPVVRPNPSNPTASIHMSCRPHARSRWRSSDVTGVSYENLITDGSTDKGPHAVEWNGRSSSGAEVSSGVYFCRLPSGNTVTSTKLVVLDSLALGQVCTGGTWNFRGGDRTLTESRPVTIWLRISRRSARCLRGVEQVLIPRGVGRVSFQPHPIQAGRRRLRNRE